MSSSKNDLKPNVILVMLGNDEFAENLPNFDELELFGTDESSDSDLCDQEDDILLPDLDGGVCVGVTDTNFWWERMDSYS